MDLAEGAGQLLRGWVRGFTSFDRLQLTSEGREGAVDGGGVLGSIPRKVGGQSCCHRGTAESLEGRDLQELGPSREEANPANPGTKWESI